MKDVRGCKIVYVVVLLPVKVYVLKLHHSVTRHMFWFLTCAFDYYGHVLDGSRSFSSLPGLWREYCWCLYKTVYKSVHQPSTNEVEV